MVHRIRIVVALIGGVAAGASARQIDARCDMETVLVRGCGDVGSAVAHVLFSAGYRVVIHDRAKPPHPRRGMAFTDAMFDGTAKLAGLIAKRARDVKDAPYMVPCRRAIPVSDGQLEDLVDALKPHVVVDARMRKRVVPESQRPLAPLSIGLGPNFTAGDNADIVVETGWGEDLGVVITSGSTRPLGAEPRNIAGFARERYIYAPVAGVLRTRLAVGEVVKAGEEIGSIGAVPICAPMAGVLRGVSHDGAIIEVGTKILEIDPRGDTSQVFGLGERPAKIAKGVLVAIRRA